MAAAPLPSHDLDALLRLWPTALCCPTWRLWGESPSPGLLHEVRSRVDRESVLRDEGGRCVGLLEVREVDRTSESGYLSFLVPSPGEEAPQPILPFLRSSLVSLGLRKITVLADGDMLGALVDVRSHLQQVGLLRDHALVTCGRYVDRHVFELVREVGQT